jgi:hypothetical protein
MEVPELSFIVDGNIIAETDIKKWAGEYLIEHHEGVQHAQISYNLNGLLIKFDKGPEKCSIYFKTILDWKFDNKEV